jgi:hypothetical protein
MHRFVIFFKRQRPIARQNESEPENTGVRARARARARERVRVRARARESESEREREGEIYRSSAFRTSSRQLNTAFFARRNRVEYPLIFNLLRPLLYFSFYTLFLRLSLYLCTISSRLHSEHKSVFPIYFILFFFYYYKIRFCIE